MVDWFKPQFPDLKGCAPMQIINFDGDAFTFDDIQTIKIYDIQGKEYNTDSLKFAYSVDGSCWSCYMSLSEVNNNIVNLNSDIFIKIKVQGNIGKILINNEQFTNYKTQLDSSFNFSTQNSQSTFDPYANMDCAIGLQQQLTETISSMFGIPIYYFKLSPNKGSKDLTFKEYTLMNVEAVKQIKLIVADGNMPSLKDDFSDWGLEFETDWETEIAKGTFATAFGNTAKPMEGDLIYIPMMQRMWMVNNAYEENNTGLMWNASTFKIFLVKYQEKGSVDLGDSQEMIDKFVKNTYDTLFGDEENQDADSDATDAPKYAANNAIPVFESDAVRKDMTVSDISINDIDKLYNRATLISDNHYDFNMLSGRHPQIIYQKKYCGDAGTISFIIHPIISEYEGNVFTIGKYFSIKIKETKTYSELYVNKDKSKLNLKLENNETYLIILRWSKELNLIDFSAYIYTYNHAMPKYALSNSAYYFDINDNDGIKQQYNNEFTITDKSEIAIEGFYGWLTNIKVFDIYNSDISEIMQTYPNNQHLIINDTARKLIDNYGVAIR